MIREAIPAWGKGDPASLASLWPSTKTTAITVSGGSGG
jgi:hypothetical protein